MMFGKKAPAKTAPKAAGKKAAFKPCAACKMPGKCAAMGKCLAKKS